MRIGAGLEMLVNPGFKINSILLGNIPYSLKLRFFKFQVKGPIKSWVKWACPKLPLHHLDLDAISHAYAIDCLGWKCFICIVEALDFRNSSFLMRMLSSLMPMRIIGSSAKAVRNFSTSSVVTYQIHLQSPVPISVLSMVAKILSQTENILSSGFAQGTGQFLKRSPSGYDHYRSWKVSRVWEGWRKGTDGRVLPATWSSKSSHKGTTLQT